MHGGRSSGGGPPREHPAPYGARPGHGASYAYEQLARRLREQILAGELHDGERLPSETALAKSENVSRSTVREALRVLQEGGYVRRASPRIMVVSEGGVDPVLRETTRALRHRAVTFDDLLEALLTIEPALTRLAAERGRPEEVEALAAQLDDQRAAAGDPELWSRLDDRFHLTIAEMSGNPALVLARRPISGILLPTVWGFLRGEEMVHLAIAFHERMVDEIRIGDGEGAALLSRKHINDFRRAWEREGLDARAQIAQLDGNGHGAPEEPARRHPV